MKLTISSSSAPSGDTGRTTTASTSMGTEAESTVWSSKNVVITASTLAGGGGSAKCTWSPAITEFDLPLAKGASTTSTGSCVIKEDGFTVNVKRDLTDHIVGQSVLTIGGTSVTTWSVAVTDDLTLTGSGLSSTIDTTGTENFDPSLGIPIKTDETATSDTTYAGKTQKSTHHVVTIAKSLSAS